MSSRVMQRFFLMVVIAAVLLGAATFLKLPTITSVVASMAAVVIAIALVNIILPGK